MREILRWSGWDTMIRRKNYLDTKENGREFSGVNKRRCREIRS